MTQPTESMEQEIISANPRKYIVAGLLIIAAFFGGLGAWAAFFPFSGAVIAPGIVKVSMERKTVQHLEGGIVDKIFVKGGDLVEKGQVLLRLKSSRVTASVSLLQGQLWVKTAEFARLKAESRFADTIVWPASLPEAEKASPLAKILQEENEVFTSKKKDLLGKTLLYISQIEQLKQKILGAEEEMSAHKKIIASIHEELTAGAQAGDCRNRPENRRNEIANH
jgi:multidrug efflux pump subunit AcrA (membrane-fusion protein)